VSCCTGDADNILCLKRTFLELAPVLGGDRGRRTRRRREKREAVVDSG
jgi:hypothetical protein